MTIEIVSAPPTTADARAEGTDPPLRAFLGGIGIGARLVTFTAIAVLLLAGLASLYIYTELRVSDAMQRQAEFDRLSELTWRLDNELLTLRRFQTEYLASRSPGIARSYEEAATRLGGTLATLRNDPAAEDVQGDIDTLDDGIEQVLAAFRDLAAASAQTGLSATDAARREAREAARSLEERLADAGLTPLRSKLLMLRGHETDFFAGAEEKGLDLVRRRREEFDPLLTIAPVSDTEKAAIVASMDGYIDRLLAFDQARVAEARQAERLTEVFAYLAPTLERLGGLRTAAEAAGGELAAARAEQKRHLMYGAGGGLFALLLFSFLILRGVSRQIGAIAFASRRLSEGELSTPIPASDSPNEIGHLSRSLRWLRDRLAEFDVRQRAHHARERAAMRLYRASMLAVADDLQGRVVGAITGIATATKNLRGAVNGIAVQADEIARQATDLSSDSAASVTNLRSLAAASTAHFQKVEDLRRRSDQLLPESREEPGSPEDTRPRKQTAREEAGPATSGLQDLAIRAKLMAFNSLILADRGQLDDESLAALGASARALTEDAATEIADMEVQFEAQRRVAVEISSVVEAQQSMTHEMLRSVEQAVARTLEIASTVSEITRTSKAAETAANNSLSAADDVVRQGEQLEEDLIEILEQARSRPATDAVDEE